ncbi:MAG: hypothetical protein GXX96_37935 [Planctomycetaceae bacterium]|nr:hypothetical protein [Planctomycetaceae bacterium]
MLMPIVYHKPIGRVAIEEASFDKGVDQLGRVLIPSDTISYLLVRPLPDVTLGRVFCCEV